MVEVDIDENGRASQQALAKRRVSSQSSSRRHGGSAEGNVDEEDEDDVHDFRRVEIIHTDVPPSATSDSDSKPPDLLQTWAHAIYKRYDTPTGRKSMDVWYCGYCGFGPISMAYDTHCNRCTHARNLPSMVEIVRSGNHNYRVYVMRSNANSDKS